jgi:anaerobic magnesium-protoporphyrin IX monomethyl ester cyclase
VKVLVINEPFVKGFNRTQRWAARTRGRVLRAPDWLAYATAVLEQNGVDAKLFDFPAVDWGKDELRQLVKQEAPDFVILDSTTPSIYSDIECAEICKEVSSAKVIMVGPHVSALPEESLRLAGGAVDVICMGEYDFTVLDVVSNYPDLGMVPGVCFQADGGSKNTGPRPLIEDLDSLPFPAWHHLDLMKYFDGSKLYPYIDIFSGRGCPHRCTFCLWPQVMHGHKVRLRSPQNVVDEMERDIRLCPQVVHGGEFFFEDDTFTLVKSNALAICEEILRRGLKVMFSVNARADTADEELFRLLKRAGCRQLLVGFESGDEGMLARMQKRKTLDDALRFMELAKKYRLEVHGCFVLGVPGETRESMERTIQHALGLGLHTVQFSAAVPFPGTAYYDRCREAGLIGEMRWDAWLCEGEQAPVVDCPGLTKEAISQAVDRGLKRFYLRPSYMIQFLLSTRSTSDLYRKLQGAWNFFSYLWEEQRRK